MLIEDTSRSASHTALPRGSSARLFVRSGPDPVLGAEELERRTLLAAADLMELTVERADLAVIAVPAPPELQAALAEELRAALSARKEVRAAETTLISLQGAHLVHAPGWTVVVAAEERLELATGAAIEAAFEEASLARLERELLASWPSTREVAPLAFRATTAGLRQRASLGQQYRALVDRRETHARLGQRVLMPQAYPPTLTSQILERVRDRLRVEARHEAIGAHLDAQFEVHSQCAERLSEFDSARRGHQLELVIILVLVLQSMLWMIEVLSNSTGD